MHPVLAGNCPGRDFLFALPGRLRPVPGLEETAQARRELAEEAARARADAEAALARADRRAAEAAGIAEKARAECDQAGEQAAAAVRAA
jgi:hypothetical protein